jgi:hypothetical protein
VSASWRQDRMFRYETRAQPNVRGTAHNAWSVPRSSAANPRRWAHPQSGTKNVPARTEPLMPGLVLACASPRCCWSVHVASSCELLLTLYCSRLLCPCWWNPTLVQEELPHEHTQSNDTRAVVTPFVPKCVACPQRRLARVICPTNELKTMAYQPRANQSGRFTVAF